MITIHVTIEKIYERFLLNNWRKSPSGPTNTQTSLGWFVQFAGSSESIKLWDTKPDWEVGDEIKITFEKEHTT